MKEVENWVERDPNQNSYLTFQGKLPPTLFRYRTVRPDSIDRLINFEIIQEGVFLSALKDLNDPDEARFNVRFASSDEKIVAYFWRGIRQSQPFLSDESVMAIAQKNFQELKNKKFVAPDHVLHYVRHAMTHIIRVACFTTSPTNFSMWANYAKYFSKEGAITDHAGICIEYRCDESWRGAALNPVRYSDEIPTIDPVERNEEAVAKVLYLKSREWRGEEEWRISSVLQATPPFEGNWQANCRVKLEGGVSGVIFGMNASDAMVNQIAARVKDARPDIALKRVVRNPLTWVREVVPLDTNDS